MEVTSGPFIRHLHSIK